MLDSHTTAIAMENAKLLAIFFFFFWERRYELVWLLCDCFELVCLYRIETESRMRMSYEIIHYDVFNIDVIGHVINYYFLCRKK